MDKLTIIKVGGKVIDNPIELAEVLQAFAAIEGPKMLIHGGGSLASTMEKAMGLTPIMVEGRRVTSKESLDVVTMVYAGLLNKNIVASLQNYDVNALGLSGADGNTVRTKRRAPQPIDFGFVGDVEEVNNAMLQNLLGLGLVPVISAITHDGKGQLLNTNADTMAAEIAMAMAKSNEVELILSFEKPGVLDANNKVLPKIDLAMFTRLKEEAVIVDGMIPKLTNAFAAIASGVKSVKLASAAYLLGSTREYTEVVKS